jgi:ribose 5-phosphate isomerase B
MRISFSSDHAGFDLKGLLFDYIRSLGHDVQDLGVYDATPSDYPDAAERIGLSIRNGEADRGILICGSGVGASVAANKIAGVRAGLCHDSYSAHQGVEHDDMNVLVLGSRVIGVETAKDLVRNFLGATFTQEERHVRRLHKVRALEAKY